jgi:hydroxymethylpyrimidine/phosphomethylpyrimidine kinase
MDIHDTDGMLLAAEKIAGAYGCAVLVKGGHSVSDANDLLYANGEVAWFNGKRIQTHNTHGTGCTLSSAIASNLAKGFDLNTSIQRAKSISPARWAPCWILARVCMRHPMNHAFDLAGEFAKEAR